MYYCKHERKLNRLRGYNYSLDGYYHVTICTKNRECFFGNIQNGIIGLNEFGLIAYNFWKQIPYHFNNIELDEFIIMPNHVHGILVIDNKKPAGNAGGDGYQIGNGCQIGNADLRSLRIDKTKMLLPKIIHGFKSSVSRKINNRYPKICFQWQKSYHDHIIRNEKSLQNVQNYIIHNPSK